MQDYPRSYGRACHYLSWVHLWEIGIGGAVEEGCSWSYDEAAYQKSSVSKSSIETGYSIFPGSKSMGLLVYRKLVISEYRVLRLVCIIVPWAKLWALILLKIFEFDIIN